MTAQGDVSKMIFEKNFPNVGGLLWLFCSLFGENHKRLSNVGFCSLNSYRVIGYAYVD